MTIRRLAFVFAACFLVACEKTQDVGNVPDGGHDGPAADTGGAGGKAPDGGAGGAGGKVSDGGVGGGAGGNVSDDGGGADTSSDAGDAAQSCAIAGATYPAGAPNPADACQECRPAASTTAWSPAADGTSCGDGRVCAAGACSDGCYIAGAFVAAGTANPQMACESCQPATSKVTWTAVTDGTSCGGDKVCVASACQAGCFIGGAYVAAGAANPANACETCQPSSSITAFTPSGDGASCGAGRVCQSAACQAGCFIGGAYVAAGAANPANACQTCQPAASTTAWSTLGDGASCGAGRVCSGGACQTGCVINGAYAAANAVNPSNACESCQPSTSTTAWVARADGTSCATGQVCSSGACQAGCFVGGQLRAPGAADPNNACRSCQPSTSTTAWTPAADGVACGNGQICRSGACGTGCLIGGTSYASGALNPANACQSCQPSASTSAFTALADGTGCATGQVCSAAMCRAGCYVGSTFVASGAANPGNACESCQPSVSTGGWTARADGTTCGAGRVCSAVSCQSGCFIGGGFVAGGAADSGNPCQSCQPGTSTSAWTPIPDGTGCGAGQVCSAAACIGGCAIAGAVYAGGMLNPANACQRCQPAASSTAWTALGDGTTCGAGQVCSAVSCRPGCYVAGAFASSGALNPANACQSCQPAASTGAWTALGDGTSCGAGRVCSAVSCLDGCYIAGAFYAANTLNPGNACQRCQPSTSTTTWTTLGNGTSCGAGGQICNAGACAAGCIVAGSFVADGAANPANACAACQAAVSTTAYSPLPDGASCGAGRQCSAGTCRSGCSIGGTSYASGALNPGNACQSCQPSASTTAWTSLADGTGCGAGQVCTQAACQSGCFIGGIFSTDGTVDPANACQRCQSATSTTAWTPFADGTSCGGGQVCNSNVCVAPDVGPCTPHTRRCGPGGSVEVCNIDGTAWVYTTTCGATCTNGLCDASGPCTPGARRCNGDTAEECAPDGTSWGFVQACATFCGGAGQCALDGLLVTSNMNLDGVVYVKGQVRVFNGATLFSPAGDLTIYADTVTVDLGGAIEVAPTGQSPDGLPAYGGSIGYARYPVPPFCSGYCPGCGGYSCGGGYGTQAGGNYGGPAWGGADSDVRPGSPSSTLSITDSSTPASYWSTAGSAGGGALRLIAPTVTIAGQLRANGQDGAPAAAPAICGFAGGGSGGGILISALTVNVSGTVSAAGGASPSDTYFTGGPGGLGRVKILAVNVTTTGTVTGALTQTLRSPRAITSATYPDPTRIYNDSGAALQLSWEKAFPAVYGYYVRLDTAASNPPTPATGEFISTEAKTYPQASLATGDDYFHLVPVNQVAIYGSAETVFHVRINSTPPSVTSSSHPDQTVWSSNPSPTFAWTFPQGDTNATGVYYVLDHDGLTVPGATATFIPTTQKQLLLPNRQPGVWVFHMLSADTRGYLTKAASHYKVKIGPDPGSGTIVGTVVDGGGAPIAGAALSINNGLFTQTTTSVGQYNFGATIPAGTWQVRATSGSRTAVKSVTVISAGVATANFTLP